FVAEKSSLLVPASRFLIHVPRTELDIRRPGPFFLFSRRRSLGRQEVRSCSSDYIFVLSRRVEMRSGVPFAKCKSESSPYSARNESGARDLQPSSTEAV